MHSRFFPIAAFVFLVAFPGCNQGSSGDDIVFDTLVQEDFTTQTADGWTIAVHHFRRSSGPSKGTPVFISSGYLESAKVVNAFPKYSLVERLAMDGWDVWTYDLRNTGDSQKSEISWDALTVDFSIDWTGIDFSFGMEGWFYSMDHFVFMDTPAALDFVLTKTGAAKVHWVAHSMGALMQYCCLQMPEIASKVKSAASMGGIGYFLPGTDYQSLFAEIFYGIGTFLAPLIPSNLPLPLKWALDKLCGNDPLKWAAVCYALDTVVGKLFWNHENVNPNLIYQFLKHSLPNTTTNCFKQFMEWASSGECVMKGVEIPASSTGSGGMGNSGFPVEPASGDTVWIGKDWNVSAKLGTITTPTLILSGGADLMCPPSHCQEVYNRISSTVKQYTECSVATGHQVDHGHVDMTMGIFARNEVFPHITQWLTERESQ